MRPYHRPLAVAAGAAGDADRAGRGRQNAPGPGSGADAPPALRAAALHGACFLAYWRGDYPATQAHSEAALRLWPLVDDRIGPLKSRQMLANALLYQGRYAEARTHFTEALAQARALEGEGDHSTTSLGGLAIIANWQGNHSQARFLYAQVVHILEATRDHHRLALALYNQGEIEHGLHDPAAAQACFERSLALCQAYGSGPLGIVQIGLALLALEREEWETARILFRESLALSRETSEDGDTAVALRGLGRLALRRGHPAEARSHLAESLRLHQKQADTRQMTVTLEEFAACLGVVATPKEAEETERGADLGGAALGEALYAALSEEALGLTCEEAVAAALQGG
jgi:tetratricopeptide (TPR) repeat protein